MRDRGEKRDRGRQRNAEVRTRFDEGTLMKAYLALQAAGVVGQQAIDAVNQFHNQGILFRERDDDDSPEDRGHSEEVHLGGSAQTTPVEDPNA